MAQRSKTGMLSLLLIGNDPAWCAAIAGASIRLGAVAETAGSVQEAIGRLLHPDARFTHVLVPSRTGQQEIEALSALVGEAVQLAVLLRLGAPANQAGSMPYISEPCVDAVLQALLGETGPFPALPPLRAADVTASLHGGGLRMRFQPILRSADLSPVGVEALARVSHASRGILHPREFLPFAAGCGQERMLTGIAASRLCMELRGGVLGDALSLTVNLPISGLLHEPSISRGVELCDMAGIAPGRVVLEVLETTLLPEIGDMARAMEGWRKAGFRLAMDDAGPSLPHWRQLMDLPFDTVKLDGAMVARSEADGLTARIVESAKRHGHYVIAEGIETAGRLARMRELGVDAVQGFLFARPLPALALPVWLREKRACVAMAA